MVQSKRHKVVFLTVLVNLNLLLPQVWTVKYNSTGSKIISAGDDRSIHIYDCPMWQTSSTRKVAPLVVWVWIQMGGGVAVNVMDYFALTNYGQIKVVFLPLFLFHLLRAWFQSKIIFFIIILLLYYFTVFQFCGSINENTSSVRRPELLSYWWKLTWRLLITGCSGTAVGKLNQWEIVLPKTEKKRNCFNTTVWKMAISCPPLSGPADEPDSFLL